MSTYHSRLTDYFCNILNLGILFFETFLLCGLSFLLCQPHTLSLWERYLRKEAIIYVTFYLLKRHSTQKSCVITEKFK